jgi:hypothetical protein
MFISEYPFGKRTKQYMLTEVNLVNRELLYRSLPIYFPLLKGSASYILRNKFGLREHRLKQNELQICA